MKNLFLLILMLSFSFLSYASFPVLEKTTNIETATNSEISTANNIQYVEGETHEISNFSWHIANIDIDTALKWSLYILVCLLIGYLIGYGLG